MYYILREVTIFGAFHVFTPNRGEKESKYSEYFVLNPHAVLHKQPGWEKKEAVLIYKPYDPGSADCMIENMIKPF